MNKFTRTVEKATDVSLDADGRSIIPCISPFLFGRTTLPGTNTELPSRSEAVAILNSFNLSDKTLESLTHFCYPGDR